MNYRGRRYRHWKAGPTSGPIRPRRAPGRAEGADARRKARICAGMRPGKPRKCPPPPPPTPDVRPAINRDCQARRHGSSQRVSVITGSSVAGAGQADRTYGPARLLERPDSDLCQRRAGPCPARHMNTRHMA
eukprot:gene16162-biopygen18766